MSYSIKPTSAINPVQQNLNDDFFIAEKKPNLITELAKLKTVENNEPEKSSKLNEANKTDKLAANKEKEVAIEDVHKMIQQSILHDMFFRDKKLYYPEPDEA